MAQRTGHDTGSQGRRPYRAPSLVDYGSVAKLTQGSNPNGTDSVDGMMASPCL